ncbi:serine/threonine-protein kinase [Mesorhizobium sp. C374B]|uniref:serine/threonine-protein kinase n=1 Tax=Mesorhizobium sp. C374B TaxID=2956830 RepID=UPI00336A685A
MSSDDKTRLLPNMADTSVGTQLSGIYELDERIASGGMGEVYRGHNIQTGDHVAIKIVLPEFARDQTILSLFRKEASILNHLSHDAVVRYHVFTIDPGIGRPYLAMEFVDGQSLYDVMRGGAMATPDVRKLCHRLASGLSAVHQAGAIHRDLSPDNIILPGGRVERAKIIDFGIARSAAVGGETLIGGKFAGKYNYVSPSSSGSMAARSANSPTSTAWGWCWRRRCAASRSIWAARNTRSSKNGGPSLISPASMPISGTLSKRCCSLTRMIDRPAWPKSPG